MAITYLKRASRTPETETGNARAVVEALEDWTWTWQQAHNVRGNE